MWEIFEKPEQKCSKLDGDYESYLYLGLIRLISSRYNCSTFVFFETFFCEIFIYIFNHNNNDGISRVRETSRNQSAMIQISRTGFAAKNKLFLKKLNVEIYNTMI